MNKLEHAAKIALDPERSALSDPEAPKPLGRLKEGVASLDAPSRSLLARAGLDLGDLAASIDAAIDGANRLPPSLSICLREPTREERMEAEERGQQLPPRLLAWIPERRRLFVLNVANVWSTTMPGLWPMGRVKASSPLVRLADAALPEQLRRHDAHGRAVSLRKAVNDALAELGWPDYRRAHEEPR
jgi:hypothetical protein